MSSCVKGKHLIDQYSELLFLAYDHVKYSTNYISMIMLDMEVISFALDSSANQSGQGSLFSFSCKIRQQYTFHLIKMRGEITILKIYSAE